MQSTPKQMPIDWNRFQWRSLKTRITLGTLAIFLSVIWTTAYFASQQQRQDLQRLIGQQHANTAAIAAADLDHDLQQRLDFLHAVAERISPAAMSDQAALQALLQQLLGAMNQFNAGLVVLGPEGVALASIPLTVKRAGVNYSDIEHVKAALKGQDGIGEPVIGRVMKKPLFDIVVPIRDAQGQALGVLMGVINLGQSDFIHSLVHLGSLQVDYFQVVGLRSGIVLSSSEQKPTTLPVVGATSQLERILANPAGADLVTDAQGVGHLIAGQRLKLANWGVLIATDAKQVLAPVDAMLRNLLLGALLITVLTGGLTWWLLRRQLAPIVNAAKEVARWSDSVAPELLPVSRADEVGQLIANFNKLLQHQRLLARRATALLELPAVAQGMDEVSFIQHALQRAEQLTTSQISFLHFVNDDQEGIELVTWSRATLENYCNASPERHYSVSQAGIWADALRKREPVVVNDYASASGKKGLPEDHATLQRFISVPVIEGGLVHIVAGVGNKGEPYTEVDVETLRLIADKIWRLISQRRAQTALQLSEQRSRSITETASDAIITADSSGAIVGWNPAAQTLFGYSQDEALGQALTLIVPQHYQAAHLAGIERLRSGGEMHVIGKTVELDGQRKSGDEFPLELTLSRWRSGEQWFATGIIRDISQRKAQQAQIHLAAQVFDQSLEGITLTDLQGTILMVNPAFNQITGYSAQEAIGQNPRLLKSGRQDAAFYRRMWDQILGTGQWSGEIWNKNKAGAIYPEWLTVSTLRDEQGVATHYMGSFSDLSRSKAAESRIHWLSNFDTVTGLPNLALLQERTRLALSMVQRANEPLSLVLVAIDHFSAINDAMGRQTGDALLTEVARHLSESVREQDTVSRPSGKDFVLVLPGTDAAGAAHLASELLGKLAQPWQANGQELSVTASIGIACFPDNGADFDALYKAVDIAMHGAQNQGRNRYAFYTSELYQKIQAHEYLMKALQQALKLGQMHLAYQPQVDLQSGQICGLEALLRWNHPELGAISPVQFIPLAEQSGLIIEIGEWVLQQACRDIAHWLKLGIDICHVAVNTSPVQYRSDNDLVAQVRAALASPGVAPERLYIEVTESTLMEDVPRNEATIRALQQLGVKLSLDDFGTGYSSLSYLKRFPFDQVKIDQSFVRDLATNPNDSVLVNVIVAMAHGLGMKVIAEGVETEAQCEIIRNSICDEIQGYFFSTPISATAIEELFSAGRQLPSHLLRLHQRQHTLLLVDDEPNIIAALKRLLHRDGYHILSANSGAEGLQLLAQHQVDVIVSDQRMPGMSGVEFLRQAKALHPNTIRIVLSGYTELQSVTDAINEGAVYRFLTKPWEDEPLREQIKKAFEYRRLLDENRQLDIKVHSANQELVAANRRLRELLQQERERLQSPGKAAS